MIQLLGWGDEVGPQRAAAERGFVPHVEALDGRVVPSHLGKVKIDFAVANPDVPAHVSTLPPVVSLAAANAGEATGLAHLDASGESGFDRGQGHWFDPAKTDKDKFEPYFASGSANGPVHVQGVWVGAGNETPAPMRKATPILF